AGKLQRQINEVFESRCEISDETPYITPTGTEGHYEYILRPVVDDQGKVEQVAGSGREITVRNRAEVALKDADRRKSEFLAILAHELRNPLAPIRNALQILRRSDGQRENAQPIFEMMERQIAQMVRLVDDLLDVSRISRGTIELRRERVELATIVSQAFETVQPMLVNMDHELTITSPAETIHVRADPARLIQILDNLLHNACKFTERGGRIRLTIEPDGDQAVIRVEDNGVGIAAENLEHVFGMFTQIDQSLERSSSGQGLGLGLTLVKTLVEMHGGSVEARSGGVGRGAEFVVRMKRLAELSAPPKVSLAAQPPESAPLRILVVDDNADAADSMAFLLELDGHEARIAGDGLHAVDEAAHWTPDVVLLDIGVPKLDGYEVARRIRAQRQGVNGVMLIAITGWGQDDDRRRSRDAGFDAHLTKPVDYVDLKKLLAQWRGGQE
ncbi:MAG: ATP-binding protein, partial [Burkholderiales bacterium]|nr:ATP-binding protein [Burkholderiales bacterium]